MEVTLGLLGQGDEPGTLNLQVTVRVFFVLGEEDAMVSCTSERHQASENFAVHSFEAYATDVLWTEDLRSGQNYTVTCSISDGNTLSKTVKVAGEGEKVTAVGGYVGESVASKTVVRNTMTLTFDTAGGPGSVEGQGNVDQEFEGSVFACPVGETTWSTERWVIDYYGAYDPDSNTFSGTMEMFHVSESWFGGGDDPCWKDVREKELSREWQATLEDGVVKGSLAPPVDSQWTFELTVQG
jgi:hypothetical protein